MEKAYFFPRVLAYIVDVILVGIVITLLGYVLPVGVHENYDIFQEEAKIVQLKFLNHEISAQEYVHQSGLISYDMDNAAVISYIVEIVCIILYFIVFQFFYGGQTIGKKIMGIKVVGIDEKPLTINDFIYRSMILNAVLVNILTIILVLFMKREFYFYVNLPLQFIQTVLLLITIFMVLFRKDGRGLHDMVGHTKVVMVK